ncbi:hypothetical protein EDC01DRAFT_730765 [Geopyxis carbonaria]|nr:hypothetical protein EDC01DRAFT_730765 [Geopyxis carbonaria]
MNPHSRHSSFSSYAHIPPPPRPQTQPSGHHAFQPHRTPFVPPSLNRDESNGSSFLADLDEVKMPPIAASDRYLNPNAQCDYCHAALSRRPQVQCIDSTKSIFYTCSECFHFGLTNRQRHLVHNQQTIRPDDYPIRQHPPPHDPASYRCDVCMRDISSSARAHCLVCPNFDLCLDCNLVGEVSRKHRPSHAVNIIRHYEDTSLLLMDSSLTPTPLLEKLLDAVFDYVDHTFAPLNTGLMEAVKISAFYSHVGVPEHLNIGRFSNDVIANEYSTIGCEYHLVSDSSDAIAARAKPWSKDGIDTTPRTPALTKRGWIRFFVLTAWREPDLNHFILNNALSTGKVMHRKKGEPYMLSVPRESFPKRSHARAKIRVGAGGNSKR